MRRAKDKRPGIMVYFDCMPIVKALNDDEAGKMFKAMLDYGRDRIEPDFADNRLLLMAWGTIKQKVDDDGFRYEEKCRDKAHAREYGVYKQKQKAAGKDYLSWEEYQEENKGRWFSEFMDDCKDKFE